MNDGLWVLFSGVCGIVLLTVGLTHWLDESERIWGKGKRKTRAIKVFCVVFGIFFLGSAITVGIIDSALSPTGPTPAATISHNTKGEAINRAKILIWEYLGEPHYDYMAIHTATNSIGGQRGTPPPIQRYHREATQWRLVVTSV